MLSNAYFLAKFRFDTAENEPAKNLQNLLIFQSLLTLTPKTSQAAAAGKRAAGSTGSALSGSRSPRPARWCERRA